MTTAKGCFCDLDPSSACCQSYAFAVKVMEDVPVLFATVKRKYPVEVELLYSVSLA